MEHRKVRRIASNAHVDFLLEHADASTRDDYCGLVENYRFGGLLIVADVHVSAGDVVHLNIEPEGEAPLDAATRRRRGVH